MAVIYHQHHSFLECMRSGCGCANFGSLLFTAPQRVIQSNPTDPRIAPQCNIHLGSFLDAPPTPWKWSGCKFSHQVHLEFQRSDHVAILLSLCRNGTYVAAYNVFLFDIAADLFWTQKVCLNDASVFCSHRIWARLCFSPRERLSPDGKHMKYSSPLLGKTYVGESKKEAKKGNVRKQESCHVKYTSEEALP